MTVATARSRSAPARGYLSDGAHRTRPWPLLDEPVEIKVYDVDDVERLARWRAHETEVGLQVFVTAARRPASAAPHGCRVVYVRLSVGARVRLSLAAGFVRNGLNWFWAWRLRPTFLHCVGWLGSRVVSVLESGAKGPGFKSQPRRSRISLGQTVHTRHKAAKLITALVRVARVTAGKVMAAYRRVYDSRHLQADCQEPGSAPEPYAR